MAFFWNKKNGHFFFFLALAPQNRGLGPGPQTPRASARLPPRPRRVTFVRSAECANVVFCCRGLVPERLRVAVPRLPPSKASRDLFRSGHRRPALRCFPERWTPASTAARPRLRGPPLFPRRASAVRLEELRMPYSGRTGGSEPLSAVSRLVLMFRRQFRG